MRITLEDSARLRELLDYLRERECIAYLDEEDGVIHAVPPEEGSIEEIVGAWASANGLRETLGE